MAEDCRCGVWLEVLIVGHELNDAVPHLCSNVVSRRRDELQDRVDIPLVLYLVSQVNA